MEMWMYVNTLLVNMNVTLIRLVVQGRSITSVWAGTQSVHLRWLFIHYFYRDVVANLLNIDLSGKCWDSCQFVKLQVHHTRVAAVRDCKREWGHFRSGENTVGQCTRCQI